MSRKKGYKHTPESKVKMAKAQKKRHRAARKIAKIEAAKKQPTLPLTNKVTKEKGYKSQIAYDKAINVALTTEIQSLIFKVQMLEGNLQTTTQQTTKQQIIIDNMISERYGAGEDTN